MTLVDDGYLEDVVGEIRSQGVTVVHVAIVAPADVVGERLRARSGEEDWGLARVGRCIEALRRERFATHLDASSAGPRELARQIAVLAGAAFPARV
jgi:chloramphenicol 3-O-phosphotransferase